MAPTCIKVKPCSRHNFPIEIRQGESFRIMAYSDKSSSTTCTFALCEAMIIPFAVWSITCSLSLRTVRNSSLVKSCLLMMWSAATLSTEYSRRLRDEFACVTFPLALPAPLSCSDFRFAFGFPPALVFEVIRSPFVFQASDPDSQTAGGFRFVCVWGLLVFLVSTLRLWRSFRSSYGPLFGILYQLFLC